jgi:hypothetical protein
MTTAQKAMVGYGVAMIAMGVQAYFFPETKPSLMSLIAAGGIGLIVLIMGVLASKAANPRGFYIGAIVFAVIGCSRFVGNLFQGKFSVYPGGVAILLSIGLIAILGMGHMSAMKARKSESPE